MLQRLLSTLRTALAGDREPLPNPATGEPGLFEERGFPASPSPRGGDRGFSRERIAVHAYHRWLSRGKPVGSDWEDWFEAERQTA